MKTLFKNLLKISISVGFLATAPMDNSAKAAECADPLTDAAFQALGGDGCSITPDMMKITFYEAGFCTSNPISGSTWDTSTCVKAFENSAGHEIDLGTQTFHSMRGNTYKIPSGSYQYGYVIANNQWDYKGKYTIGGTTYYTATGTSSDMHSTAGNYGIWSDDISFMNGSVDAAANECWDYIENSSFGLVKSLLVSDSLVVASDQTACNNATKMVGSQKLPTAVTITDKTTTYKVKWIVKGMGMKIIYDAGGADDFSGGPFTAEFSIK